MVTLALLKTKYVFSVPWPLEKVCYLHMLGSLPFTELSSGQMSFMRQGLAEPAGCRSEDQTKSTMWIQIHIHTQAHTVGGRREKESTHNTTHQGSCRKQLLVKLKLNSAQILTFGGDRNRSHITSFINGTDHSCPTRLASMMAGWGEATLWGWGMNERGQETF